jgi:hypothetical protein
MRMRSSGFAGRWGAMGAVAALMVATFSSCADDGPDAAGSVAAAVGGAAAAATGDVLQPGSTVEFVANEFSFAPTELVAGPGTYDGVLVNEGTIEHDIAFD